MCGIKQSRKIYSINGETDILFNICYKCKNKDRCHYCASCPVGKPDKNCVWHNCQHVKRIAERLLK